MGIVFSDEAARRIAAAVKKVERAPRDRAGDHTREFLTDTGFWAMLLGCDISGIKYTFNRVTFDPKSTLPHAFTIANTLRFGFEGENFADAAIEVNATRGIRFGTIVWCRFAGYDTDEKPVFLFSHPQMDPNMPVPPHDHRDNNNGGFSYATYHPGTAIPGHPFPF